MLDFKRHVLSFSLLSVFPFGWYFSIDLLTSGALYYTVLSIAALLSAVLILRTLRGSDKREVHRLPAPGLRRRERDRSAYVAS